MDEVGPADRNAWAMVEAAAFPPSLGEVVESAAGIGSWEVDLLTGRLRLSPNACHLHGLSYPPAPERATLTGWLTRLHPEDRPRAEQLVVAVIRDGGRFRHEFRLRHGRSGEWRWFEGRGRRIDSPDGTPLRLVGIDIDIASRKEREAQSLLALREVEHRAKNALATAQAVVRLTRAEDPRDFARSVEQRLAALGRAHARLSAATATEGVSLRSLAEDEFGPYGRAHALLLRGPEVALAARAVQPACMALHELVTNAAKYGALSRREGRVSLTWRRREDGGVWLRWAEHGGPAVALPPTRRGFGLAMLDAVVRGQLHGLLRFTWAPDGLRVLMCLPAASVNE
jgi:PAS domain S-box-containing protein